MKSGKIIIQILFQFINNVPIIRFIKLSIWAFIVITLLLH